MFYYKNFIVLRKIRQIPQKVLNSLSTSMNFYLHNKRKKSGVSQLLLKE